MKKNEDAAAKKKPKTSAAQIRVQKGASYTAQAIYLLKCLPDLTELDLPSTMQTHFPDPADLLNFTLTITPDEGMLLLYSPIFEISYPCQGMYKGRRIHILLCDQYQLPTRPSKGQVHTNRMLYYCVQCY